jgi:hypothetical protein
MEAANGLWLQPGTDEYNETFDWGYVVLRHMEIYSDLSDISV